MVFLDDTTISFNDLLNYGYTNILLIDESVSKYQEVVDSCNSSTLPIVYSYNSSTDNLLNLLNNTFNTITRIGLFFSSTGMVSQMFLDSKPFFENNEIQPYSTNVQFMINIINKFNIANIDFLACDTLNYPTYVNYYNILAENTSVIIGASNDKTGNIKYGGDWVMESTKENIELIYFTQNIEYYKYLLDISNFTVVLVKNGGPNTLYSCGNNFHGQLARGDFVSQNVLKQITDTKTKTPVSVSCGGSYTIVLMSDGTAWGCGANPYGQLGIGNNNSDYSTTNQGYSTLQQMPITTPLIPTTIYCGGSHTLVLMSNGEVWCCGYNFHGQLGLGNTTNQTSLIKMENGTGKNIQDISCGNHFSVVLMSDGTVYSCGKGGSGQLGTGTTSDKNVLTQMKLTSNSYVSNVVDIACGVNHSLIIMSNGEVWGCGENVCGQLGLGNTTNQNYLIKMTNTTGQMPHSINCGGSHSVITMSNGEVWGCGQNVYGQLGLGNTTNQTSLVKMIIPDGQIPVAVSCGENTTILLMEDGAVWGCGQNGSGQLGVNTTVGFYDTLQQMKVVDSNGNVDPITNVAGINTVPVNQLISNICFPAGTPIICNQGVIPIEKINPNIHTIRNKSIIGITQTITHDKYLVCFEKDSIRINIPSQKTIISKNHKIFLNKKMMQANEFIGLFENVYKIKYNGEILYNVLMEDYDKMVVNNLVCETLHPEHGVAQIHKVLHLLSPIDQENLIKTYNEHVKKRNMLKRGTDFLVKN